MIEEEVAGEEEMMIDIEDISTGQPSKPYLPQGGGKTNSPKL